MTNIKVTVFEKIAVALAFMFHKHILLGSPEHEVLKKGFCNSAVSAACRCQQSPFVDFRSHIIRPIFLKNDRNNCLDNMLIQIVE